MAEVASLSLPDVTQMQQELQASGLLVPELVPQAMATITQPSASPIPANIPPSGPIQLASTTPQYKLTQAPDHTVSISPMKLASWIFILLSFGIVMMIGYSLWQQGLRIEVTTDEDGGQAIPATNQTRPFTNTPEAY